MKDNRLVMQVACKIRFEAVRQAIEELLSKNEKEIVLIAIDGKCASGKTTLGYYLKSLYDCNLFHMDDFFLQPYQRTGERMKEIGGNVDYERFQKEVIKPIIEGKAVGYRPFSCMEKKIKEEIEIPPKRLNIIEGSYSMHPYFKDPYDLHIFTDISEVKQIENIRNRNGEERLLRFVKEWIPKEEAYFNEYDIPEGCIRIQWTK